MTSFLRWAAATVMITIALGGILAYPTLRQRLAPTSAPATPTPSGEQLAVEQPAILATPVATIIVGNVGTRPAVVIESPRSTPNISAPTAPPQLATIAPAPVATTALLPAAVLAPPAAIIPPTATSVPGVPTPLTTAQPSPSPTFTAIALAVPTAAPGPSAPQPHTLVENGAATPAPDSAAPLTGSVAPPVPEQESPTDDVEIAPTEQPPLPTPVLPTANRAVQLYRAPMSSAAIAASLQAGEPVDIVALFTEGTWYLLTDGLWIPADAVTGAPLLLPLVVPTPTFTPSPTPTPTFTPLPTVPAQPLTTPIPTPTSLAEPVCACDTPTYSCVSADFPNRQAAQLCFEYCFRIRGFDVHTLDPNFNGQACENLPPVQQ